jgi:hypothetical protein
MEAGLVSGKVVAEAIDTMLASIELNGPIGFSDFSVAMWVKIIEFRARYSPSTASDVASRLVRWTFLRWQPCR